MSAPITTTSCPSCNTVDKYGDFAKPVNDFFSKEFPTGLVKLEAKALSRSLFASRPGKDTFTDEFKVTATRDNATGTISAEVKSTTVFPLLNSKSEAKSVTTIASSNLLTQQVTITNAVIEGLKLEVVGTLQPSGANTTKAQVELKKGGCLVSTSSVDLFRGPILTTDLATRCRDIHFGGEVAYDVTKGTLDKYSLAVGLNRPREKAFLQALTGFKTFTASYLQKCNDQLEVACRTLWNTKMSSLSMELGAKWYLLGGGFVKAKVDNVGRLGLALASDIRPGLQVLLGASVDTGRLQENAHRLGVEFNYTA